MIMRKPSPVAQSAMMPKRRPSATVPAIERTAAEPLAEPYRFGQPAPEIYAATPEWDMPKRLISETHQQVEAECEDRRDQDLAF